MKVARIAFEEREAGDVGLLDGRGLMISGAIELGEQLAGEVIDGTHWSHAWLAGVKPHFTLEAIWPRVSLSPWDIYQGQRTAVFRIEASAEAKLAALLQIEHEWLGRGYNLVGVIGLGAEEVERHFGFFRARNPLDDPRKSFCSELATRYLHLLVGDDAAAANTDPQALYNYLNALAQEGGTC